jgi:Holliday junction resolvase
MTTNYARGRRKEYAAMHELSDRGWLVARSAMSHGPFDIFAAREGTRLMVQVKSGKGRLDRAGRRELRRWAKEFNAEAQLWTFGKRRKKGHTVTVVWKPKSRAHVTG